MYAPAIALRVATDEERTCSCNGCHEPAATVAMLEVGSRGTEGRGGGSGFDFRMCPECLLVYAEKMHEGLRDIAMSGALNAT